MRECNDATPLSSLCVTERMAAAAAEAEVDDTSVGSKRKSDDDDDDTDRSKRRKYDGGDAEQATVIDGCKLTVTAGMTEDEKEQRDKALLADSREAKAPLRPADYFPTDRRAWLTDAQLDRAVKYAIRTKHSEAVVRGWWKAPLDLPITLNYPISFDALKKRILPKRAEERFKSPHVCFEPVCYKQSHYIAVVYDTRDEVKTEAYPQGRITVWDPFGYTTAACQTQSVLQKKHGSTMQVYIAPEAAQSDSYQCSIWVVGLFVEYMGAVASNSSDPFTLEFKQDGVQILYDLARDHRAAARYANASWVSAMRDFLLHICHPVNSIAAIERECIR